MFALGIRYLTGRAVAAAWQNRGEPEWPPHPDRVFMALVAAHGETGTTEDEAAALRWLEGLPRPALRAGTAWGRRDTVTAFVPVNDKADPVLKGKALSPMGSLPFGRIRQPRQYPTVLPAEESVYLIWPDATVPAEHRPVLERLCTKVTYLGHSSSLVQLWVEEAPPTPTLIPTEGRSTCRLRVFGPGRLDDLRARHDAGLRPQPSLWQGYASTTLSTAPAWPRSPFDENLIILRQVAGRRWQLESALLLGQTLRRALLARTGAGKDKAPEWLSGHDSNNAPSRSDHLAVVPLGFVGSEHADGHLLGLGLAVPRDLPGDDVAGLLPLLGEHPGYPEAEPGYPYVKLALAGGSTCDLELDDRPEPARPYTLRPGTYAGPARRWATVTPVVLDRFPRRRLSAEEVLAAACRRAGLPEPVAVRLGAGPNLPGVPNARSFPPLPKRKGRAPWPITHAVLTFDEPVLGPVLVGTGRYLGYGLCRPLPDDTGRPA
jgi:CRISPR-associated protein Csb2